jgi:hypothetical protein
MKTEKTYRWANEWNDRDGYCDDRVYSDSLKDLELPSSTRDEHGRMLELTLVVDLREDGELIEHQWAPVRYGYLPSHFDDGTWTEGIPVPGRYRAELHEFLKSKL